MVTLKCIKLCPYENMMNVKCVKLCCQGGNNRTTFDPINKNMKKKKLQKKTTKLINSQKLAKLQRHIDKDIRIGSTIDSYDEIIFNKGGSNKHIDHHYMSKTTQIDRYDNKGYKNHTCNQVLIEWDKRNVIYFPEGVINNSWLFEYDFKIFVENNKIVINDYCIISVDNGVYNMYKIDGSIVISPAVSNKKISKILMDGRFSKVGYFPTCQYYFHFVDHDHNGLKFDVINNKASAIHSEDERYEINNYTFKSNVKVANKLNYLLLHFVNDTYGPTVFSCGNTILILEDRLINYIAYMFDDGFIRKRLSSEELRALADRVNCVTSRKIIPASHINNINTQKYFSQQHPLYNSKNVEFVHMTDMLLFDLHIIRKILFFTCNPRDTYKLTTISDCIKNLAKLNKIDIIKRILENVYLSLSKHDSIKNNIVNNNYSHDVITFFFSNFKYIKDCDGVMLDYFEYIIMDTNIVISGLPYYHFTRYIDFLELFIKKYTVVVRQTVKGKSEVRTLPGGKIIDTLSLNNMNEYLNYHMGNYKLLSNYKYSYFMMKMIIGGCIRIEDVLTHQNIECAIFALLDHNERKQYTGYVGGGYTVNTKYYFYVLLLHPFDDIIDKYVRQINGKLVDGHTYRRLFRFIKNVHTNLLIITSFIKIFVILPYLYRPGNRGYYEALNSFNFHIDNRAHMLDSIGIKL